MSHGNLLSLREATQHAKCAQCVRYKMLIKKLAGDEVARKHQLHEYERHLGKQYLDRTYSILVGSKFFQAATFANRQTFDLHYYRCDRSFEIPVSKIKSIYIKRI